MLKMCACVCMCVRVRVCVHRYYSFEGLAPGSQYTIKVISISGEKRSKPSDIILHTSTLNMYSESRVRIDNRYSWQQTSLIKGNMIFQLFQSQLSFCHTGLEAQNDPLNNVSVIILMPVCHVVPEVPQEVVLSGQVVTSVFVTWRQPPGGVKGYKVRHDLRSSERINTGIIPQ